jgi:hypothetical protein
MSGSFWRLLELQSPPERIRGLRQSARGLLYLRDVSQRLGRIDTLAGHRQGFRLSQQGSLVVWSPCHRSRVRHQGLFQVP